MNLNESGTRINNVDIEQILSKSDNKPITFKKQESFRQAIENSVPSGIAVVDNTGKQVYVNRSFCKMVGWDEEELMGKYPPYPYWHSQGIETIKNAFQQTLDNKAPKEGFDLLFCNKKGEQIPVNVVISSFLYENNETFYLANIIDITRRKKIESSLRESQILLKSSIESHKDTIIFSIDCDYKYLYFNTAHFDAMKFAYGREIETGMNFLGCIATDDDRNFLKGNVDQALSGESNSHIRTFGKVNIDYYETFFSPVLNEKNEITGCTVLARNITERMLAEQALRDSETKFKEIINQINDVIIVFDRTGKIIIWNKGAEQICGLKAEYALDRNIVDVQCQLTPPPYNDKALIEKAINGILTFETPQAFNQIIDSEIIPFNSGNQRSIQSMVFPVNLNGDHLFCVVIRDTTELKRYEKELLRVSTEKDKFYSMVAQYLYTPFNVFNNFSHLMAEELDNLPIKEIQKMAGMMSKSASNLYSLLDNLLQWTRMNQGKISFEPQFLNLKKTSHEAVSVLKSNNELKEFKVNFQIEDEINVFADLYMLKTILRNLVSFALKSSTSDTPVDILARQTSSEVEISIRDKGNVLSSDHLRNLFDVTQIHKTIGDVEDKGIALGLLLSKEFVEKHNGRIWIGNEDRKGNGISFTLPLKNG